MITVESLPFVNSLLADVLLPKFHKELEGNPLIPWLPTEDSHVWPHLHSWSFLSCPFLRLISPLSSDSLCLLHHLTPSKSNSLWNQPWPLSHLFPLQISSIFKGKAWTHITSQPLLSQPNFLETSAHPILPLSFTTCSLHLAACYSCPFYWSHWKLSG